MHGSYSVILSAKGKCIAARLVMRDAAKSGLRIPAD